MVKKKKIILVAPSLSSFVKTDIDILSKEYMINTNIYDWSNKHLTPVYLIHQLLFMIFTIPNTDKIIVQFGGYWSLFPALIGKVFGKPVFIILHGTDCSSIPSINYGSLRKFLLRVFCGYSYKLATALLPVSDSLKGVKNTFYNNDEQSFQGLEHFFSGLKTPVHVIHNGLNVDFWKPLDNINKEPNSFMAVFSNNQYILKGGDLITEMALSIENAKFYIAGSDAPSHMTSLPDNVIFLGKLTKEQLIDYYNKAQFYFQLSIFEGFGLSLCEAMLCECIPIGSSVNIIPEIIGDTGFILEKKDSTLMQKVVKKALATENKKELGEKARARVIDKYSLEKRVNGLLSILNKY